ncbi:MAG: OsmC family protein [Actinobacteria bacterium]|nr:OsmC family protein [Actinomycetota bacterium]
MTDRTVRSRWDGDLRAVVYPGDFELLVDEPESVGGTDRGPQPTDLLLASVASCFVIALAYSARKQDVELGGLDVEVTGRYDGPRFSHLRITVRAKQPQGAELDRLVSAAERVCYVTSTLRRSPEIEVVSHN